MEGIFSGANTAKHYRFFGVDSLFNALVAEVITKDLAYAPLPASRRLGYKTWLTVLLLLFMTQWQGCGCKWSSGPAGMGVSWP